MIFQIFIRIFFFVVFIIILSCEKTLTCPDGMTLVGNSCYLIEETYDVKEVNINPDLNLIDSGVDTSETITDTTEGYDTQKEEDSISQTKGIGSACIKDEQCGQGLVCLDWNMGYCTKTECDECTEGTTCISISKTAKVCLKKCSDNNDCRILEGYACKILAGENNKKESVCYEVDEPQAKIADTCKGHNECSGKSACLLNISDGYCSNLFCETDSPCSETSACVYFSGIPVCMKKCESNEDCKTDDGKERACTQLKDYITKKDVKVCTTGTTGKDFYSQCLNDFECKTQKCFLMFKGKCSFSGQGCLETKDCKDGGFCMEVMDSYTGLCTENCGQSETCNEGFCIKDPIGALFCSMPCEGPSDEKCRKDLEMSCIFGDPVDSHDKYVCGRIAVKGAGYPCKENGDCNSVECLKKDSSGYCLSPCTGIGECPFPASCQLYNNNYRCYLRCFSNNDCPSGMTCKLGPQTLVKICLP